MAGLGGPTGAAQLKRYCWVAQFLTSAVYPSDKGAGLVFSFTQEGDILLQAHIPYGGVAPSLHFWSPFY